MKAFLQLAAFAALFFLCWFLLDRIDFMGTFRIEKLSMENERKLGDLIVETLTAGHPALEADSTKGLSGEILRRLCEANGIPDSSVRLTVIANSDVNAFALPDRRMIVHSGLIDYCKAPEELAGVMGHELAHIERDHVMQKLVKEIGLSMLLTIAGGRSGGEILRQTARTVSSTAFDREQETEADTISVRYVARAGIDPEHLANFLYRLSQEKNSVPRSLEWVSTHPHSADRAAEILRLRKETAFTARPVADSAAWSSYRRSVVDAARD